MGGSSENNSGIGCVQYFIKTSCTHLFFGISATIVFNRHLFLVVILVLVTSFMYIFVFLILRGNRLLGLKRGLNVSGKGAASIYRGRHFQQ